MLHRVCGKEADKLEERILAVARISEKRIVTWFRIV